MSNTREEIERHAALGHHLEPDDAPVCAKDNIRTGLGSARGAPTAQRVSEALAHTIAAILRRPDVAAEIAAVIERVTGHAAKVLVDEHGCIHVHYTNGRGQLEILGQPIADKGWFTGVTDGGPWA